MASSEEVLLKAAKHGKVDTLKKLVEEGANLEACSPVSISHYLSSLIQRAVFFLFV